ncbi:MAG: hypothetical protein K2O03_06030, partial [Lachnospiraceae bacterium]|nr:hypothetical protein [Lachnospiraceae bacterium]
PPRSCGASAAAPSGILSQIPYITMPFLAKSPIFYYTEFIQDFNYFFRNNFRANAICPAVFSAGTTPCRMEENPNSKAPCEKKRDDNIFCHPASPA